MYLVLGYLRLLLESILKTTLKVVGNFLLQFMLVFDEAFFFIV